MPPINTNISRVLVGGQRNETLAQQSRSTLQSGNPPTLIRAVVVDVIFDPSEITDELLNSLRDSVANPEFLDNMPANSIIARIVSNSQDNIALLPSVFYPLFQSHLMLPLQAGEHVWVMFEDFQKEGTSLGRWLTRIHENQAVEDPNFTHSDRRLNFSLNQNFQRTSQQRQDRESANTTPSFPNGGGTADSFTLQQNGNINPYQEIYDNSAASKEHTYEVVPKWTKRPQEFVVQGMNNSLIVLGQDRTGPAKKETNSRDKKDYSGTVDIVCGRGRYRARPEDTAVPENKKTSPHVVENSRRKLENDKTPFQRRKTKNKSEGNPDAKTDAARVLVTMSSEVDSNFRLVNSSDPNAGINYPQNSLKPLQQPSSPNASVVGTSYVLAKADHIRVIARKEDIPSPDSGTIKGTVLLVKEGAANEDLAYLFIDEGGQVQVEGKKIYLAQSTQENEPYIKWSIYEKHINELKAQIDALAMQVQEIVTQYNAAFAASITIPFTPVASLVAVGSTTLSTTAAKVTQIKTKIESINPAEAKSTKIFGQ